VNKCQGLEFNGRQFAGLDDEFQFAAIALRVNCAQLGIGQECVDVVPAIFAEVGNQFEMPILC
jgi:hypothetical protein